MTRLREQLLKLPAWVQETVRRVVVHLPSSWVGESDWQRVAVAVGATLD